MSWNVRKPGKRGRKYKAFLSSRASFAAEPRAISVTKARYGNNIIDRVVQRAWIVGFTGSNRWSNFLSFWFRLVRVGVSLPYFGSARHHFIHVVCSGCPRFTVVPAMSLVAQRVHCLLNEGCRLRVSEKLGAGAMLRNPKCSPQLDGHTFRAGAF